MRTFLIIPLLVLFWNQLCNAQALSYKFPENFDQSYNFHPEEALQSLSKSVKNAADINGSMVEEIYNLQYCYDADKIYLNWDEVENYLIRCMDTLYKDSLVSNSINKLNISITRNLPYFSSPMSRQFYPIDVRYIATFRSESSLAYDMAYQMGYLFAFKKNLTKEQVEILYVDTARKVVQDKKDYFQVASVFAINLMSKYNYSLADVKKQYENRGLKWQVYYESKGYEQILAREKHQKELVSKKRQKVVAKEHRGKHTRKDSLGIHLKKKFVVDSVFFEQLRKACHNETKLLMFDNANYNSCAELAFVDFLREPKNLKNLYLLTESIRRLMYTSPKADQEPFLLHDYDDDDLFYAHKSILYKPDYLFSDYDEYLELKDHPLFMMNEKPFNTYKEAFLYFTDMALSHKFNEANFSRALFYYGEKQIDSVNKYLDIYIANGSGLNQAMAAELRKHGQPHCEGSKTFILVDNIGNFTGRQFNYYLSKQRIDSNNVIASAFKNDLYKYDLTIMNELLGNKPKDLFWLQKLKANVQCLYKEEDIQTFKKIRLASKETQDEFSLSKKFNKHFMILAPEYYSWFKERDYRTLYFIESVHQYRGYMDIKDEAFNTFTGYYLDINAIRPYFKDAVRSGFRTKEPDKKNYAELAEFLYWKP